MEHVVRVASGEHRREVGVLHVCVVGAGGPDVGLDTADTTPVAAD